MRALNDEIFTFLLIEFVDNESDASVLWWMCVWVQQGAGDVSRSPQHSNLSKRESLKVSSKHYTHTILMAIFQVNLG